ncbi:MAG: hypothetical protein LBM98_02005 [Oscillospiraceae bacterium]|nr:hypothetical protein [Oscillospiraceae bacterium]
MCDNFRTRYIITTSKTDVPAQCAVFASRGKVKIYQCLAAKQSSAAVRRYVCYAPGTGLLRA